MNGKRAEHLVTPPADEAQALVVDMLEHFLAAAKRGKIKFCAIVATDGNGSTQSDFKGRVDQIPLGNTTLDYLKGNLLMYLMQHTMQQPKSIVPVKNLPPAFKG